VESEVVSAVAAASEIEIETAAVAAAAAVATVETSPTSPPAAAVMEPIAIVAAKHFAVHNIIGLLAEIIPNFPQVTELAKEVAMAMAELMNVQSDVPLEKGAI
jgi:hypothetical protein